MFQADGLLVAAGDTDTIRIWDMAHELAKQVEIIHQPLVILPVMINIY